MEETLEEMQEVGVKVGEMKEEVETEVTLEVKKEGTMAVRILRVRQTGAGAANSPMSRTTCRYRWVRRCGRRALALVLL